MVLNRLKLKQGFSLNQRTEAAVVMLNNVLFRNVLKFKLDFWHCYDS